LKQHTFNRLGSVFVLLAALLAFVGCAGQTATPTTAEKAPAATEAAPAAQVGVYENTDLGFTVSYHAESFPVENEIRPEFNEVLSREGDQKVPSIAIQVSDIKDGLALENIDKQIKADFIKNWPDADRFKVVESKMVKLESGVDANQTILKWKYQGSVPLYTACVSAYKDGKAIQIFTTSVPGQPPVDVLMQMASGLTFK
jgi:hypothetical protein